ncbi:MAG: flagellar basal-body rod protein FlgF [Casimicrobiaceae bacterium]
MDRLVYISMAGAQQLLEQQAVSAHNLANASTTGFKADTTAFRFAPVTGPGLPTRAYAIDSTTGADLTPGTVQTTGRDLDVAIQGQGFFAVQGRDGTEAYTRDGGLSINADGALTTRSGLTVLGDGGPITIPPDSKIAIAHDGTVSVTAFGQSSANVTVVGKLKLVNPANNEVGKGTDGLFRMKSGAAADADPAVQVAGGSLEASNVNAVTAMVEMINLARQFEMHMKMLQNVEGNEQRAAQLLSTSSS